MSPSSKQTDNDTASAVDTLPASDTKAASISKLMNGREAELAEAGFDAKSFLKTLTTRPGVYQMLDDEGAVLYIGKAKNLKNRVSSYFRNKGLNNKTIALVSKIHEIQITVTQSETEALLLEQNLIKQYRPPYNILLRDDKSYPYVFLSDAELAPRLSFHRGAKRQKGRYFGPYPSAAAVRQSLHTMQKVFQVRQCEDSYYKNRSRPCLQYQIKRCLGPCCDMVSKEEYAEAVRRTEMFLEGKEQHLVQELANDMEAAAERLDFERAAILRDQIAHLQRVQETQYIEGDTGDVDIIAAAVKSGIACVQMLFVRHGRMLGSRSFYPKLRLDDSKSEVLEAFVAQFYLGGERDIPRQILISEALDELEGLSEAISDKAGVKVALQHSVRGNRARWLKLAVTTAEQNLKSKISSKQNMLDRFEQLQDALSLDMLPERIECFDISHSSGEATVASCVVFDQNGPLKSDYRRFNITDITAGDDYAAMAQALKRRYQKIQADEGKLPDILLIDGGKGQLKQALETFEDLQISGVILLGVAKGEGRKPGLETLVFADHSVNLPADSPALHLIQQVRDEAHRFAITGHKQRRDKARKTSTLEQIPGVGPKRRRDLLRFFGGLQGIARASVEEIAKVQGINEKLAEDIYAELHRE